MRTIWKYKIPLDDVFSIEMPKESEVLTVMTQDGEPHIWAEVTYNEKRTVRKLFYLLATGNMAMDLTNLKYIGSFLLMDDKLVFHLYQSNAS